VQAPGRTGEDGVENADSTWSSMKMSVAGVSLEQDKEQVLYAERSVVLPSGP
jgi:hypothetical protein